ncbi:hypothetical protein, partial [Methylibium sp. T29]
FQNLQIKNSASVRFKVSGGERIHLPLAAGGTSQKTGLFSQRFYFARDVMIASATFLGASL